MFYRIFNFSDLQVSSSIQFNPPLLFTFSSSSTISFAVEYLFRIWLTRVAADCGPKFAESAHHRRNDAILGQCKPVRWHKAGQYRKNMSVFLYRYGCLLTSIFTHHCAFPKSFTS